MTKKLLKSIEIVLRNAIIYPLLRSLLRNKPHSGTIDLARHKKIIIFRQDRIGDMIISTPIFRKIKSEYPHIQLTVLASPVNAAIVENDPNIDRLVVKENHWIRAIRQTIWLRKQNYDILLNFIFNKTTTIGIFARIICPRAIKISQGPEKYHFYFNHFMTLERGKKHTGELYIELTEKVFGIKFDPNEDLYQLFIDDDVREQINQYIGRTINPSTVKHSRAHDFILLNISATDPEKSFSAAQAQEIARHLAIERKIFTVVISAPWDNSVRNKIVAQGNSTYLLSFPQQGTATLPAIAELSRRAAFIVTPDTALIHFASAMRTPVIGVYTPLQYTEEWFPYKIDHHMVMAQKNKPVAYIPVTTIIKNIDLYILKYFNTRHMADVE